MKPTPPQAHCGMRNADCGMKDKSSSAPHSPLPTPHSPLHIAFYTGGDKISQLIRWRTWGGPSHVGILTTDGHNVLHARALKGVRIDPLLHSAPIGTRVDILRLDLPPADHSTLWRLAEAQIGKPYDYLGNLGFVLRRPIHSKTSWFCSELVAWLCWAAGHPLLARTPSWKHSPEDLWRSPLLHPVTSFHLAQDPGGTRFLRLTTPEPQKHPQNALAPSPAPRQPPPAENRFANPCKPLPGETDPLPFKSAALEDLQ